MREKFKQQLEEMYRQMVVMGGADVMKRSFTQP